MHASSNIFMKMHVFLCVISFLMVREDIPDHSI